MADVIIRQARVVDSQQDTIADVAIVDGKIKEVETNISENASYEVDAEGLVLMPGGIDPHVHFNEPGRTEWEGLATGSRALAKGGFTSFFDMPLNSSPTTTTAEAYHTKRQLADEKSLVSEPYFTLQHKFFPTPGFVLHSIFALPVFTTIQLSNSYKGTD